MAGLDPAIHARRRDRVASSSQNTERLETARALWA
jgi:hypothetical protein